MSGHLGDGGVLQPSSRLSQNEVIWLAILMSRSIFIARLLFQSPGILHKPTCSGLRRAKATESHPGFLCHPYRKRGRSRKRRQKRDPDRGALLHHLVARPARIQHVAGGEVDLPAHPEPQSPYRARCGAPRPHETNWIPLPGTTQAAAWTLPVRALMSACKDSELLGWRHADPGSSRPYRAHLRNLADRVLGGLGPAQPAAGSTREITPAGGATP